MSVRYAPDGRKIHYKDSDPWAGGVYESHASHSRRVRTKKAERAGVSYEAYPEWARAEKASAAAASKRAQLNAKLARLQRAKDLDAYKRAMNELAAKSGKNLRYPRHARDGGYGLDDYVSPATKRTRGRYFKRTGQWNERWGENPNIAPPTMQEPAPIAQTSPALTNYHRDNLWSGDISQGSFGPIGGYQPYSVKPTATPDSESIPPDLQQPEEGQAAQAGQALDNLTAPGGGSQLTPEDLSVDQGWDIPWWMKVGGLAAGGEYARRKMKGFQPSPAARSKVNWGEGNVRAPKAVEGLVHAGKGVWGDTQAQVQAARDRFSKYGQGIKDAAGAVKDNFFANRNAGVADGQKLLPPGQERKLLPPPQGKLPPGQPGDFAPKAITGYGYLPGDFPVTKAEWDAVQQRGQYPKDYPGKRLPWDAVPGEQLKTRSYKDLGLSKTVEDLPWKKPPGKLSGFDPVVEAEAVKKYNAGTSNRAQFESVYPGEGKYWDAVREVELKRGRQSFKKWAQAGSPLGPEGPTTHPQRSWAGDAPPPQQRKGANRAIAAEVKKRLTGQVVEAQKHAKKLATKNNTTAAKAKVTINKTLTKLNNFEKIPTGVNPSSVPAISGAALAMGISVAELINTYGTKEGGSWTFRDPRSKVLTTEGWGIPNKETGQGYAWGAVGETARALIGAGQGGYEALANMGPYPEFGMMGKHDDLGTQFDTMMNLPGEIGQGAVDMYHGITGSVGGAGRKIADAWVGDPGSLPAPTPEERERAKAEYLDRVLAAQNR